MDEALARYRTRAQAILDASPPASVAQTRTLLVDPLLSVLGWGVRAPTCESDRTVAGEPVEYVLSVHGPDTNGDGPQTTPAMLVAVDSADASLRSGRVDRLRTVVAETGVDRVVYTNGRRIGLLAGPTREDSVAFDLESIDEHAEALGHFQATTVDRRLDRASRDAAARRLAVRQEALLARLTADLTSVVGDAYRPACERGAREFLSRFASALRAENELVSNATADGSVHPTLEDESNADGVGSGESRDGTATTPPASPPDEPTGEYVVRFFADHGSVGAVGHSTPSDALVAAAEYLFERGLSGVRTPWIPGDDEDPTETVLNDDPTLADGTPMPAAQMLSNGSYVNTGGDVETKSRRVKALAERAGLRAMVDGDWSNGT